MVAWDNEGATSDDYLSAAAFFNQMDTGATVAGALQTLLAAGYGRSQSGGKTATLGYQGNGSLTLAHLAGRVNSPTPTPTRVSPPATSTPAPIATKTPTPTAVSLPRLAAVLRSRVSPGSRQTVAVTSDPRVPVRLTVTYPNGDQLTKAGTTDASGSTRLSYRQRASEITRESSTAHVTVEAGRAPRVTTVQRSYRIGWSAVDVSVEPRVASPGRSVTIWVHARPGTAAKVTVGASHRTLARLAGRTDRSGWARLRYAIPRAQAAGSLLVSAAVSRRSKRFTTSTTLRVR
jgi:hypothetical protein